MNENQSAKIFKKTGLIISLLFTIVISVMYIWIYFDGVFLPSLGWTMFRLIFYFIFTEFLISLLRTSILINENFRSTKIYFITSWISSIIVLLSFIAALLYVMPLNFGLNQFLIYLPLYPFFE